MEERITAATIVFFRLSIYFTFCLVDLRFEPDSVRVVDNVGFCESWDTEGGDFRWT